MNTQYILSVGSFIVSFLACFFALVPYTGYKYSLHKFPFYKSSAYLPIYALILVAFTIIYFANSVKSDFLHDLNYSNIIVPLLSAGLIYAFSLTPELARFKSLTIAAAAIVSSFFLPPEFYLFEKTVPFWADRLIIIFLWWAFGYCYVFLNKMDGILPLQNMTFSLGLTLLGFLGALPQLFMLFGLCLLAVNLAFILLNWYPAKISLSDGAACSFGFIFGWLALAGSAEGCMPCMVILGMYYFLEVLTAYLQKLSLKDEYKNPLTNTSYYQVNVSGLSPDTIVRHLVKLEIIFVILSIFEIYAPNAYSVPLLAFIMGAWFLSRLRNWQTPEKSLKELNREMLENIKNGLDVSGKKDN